jgi:hypothetical protein
VECTVQTVSAEMPFAISPSSVRLRENPRQVTQNKFEKRDIARFASDTHYE